MQQQPESGLEEVTAIVSRFVSATSYDDLPRPIADRVKKSILDTIGIIMPASQLMPDLRPPIDLFIEAGGKAESTVLAYGVKLPCWAAAFANGLRGHALDYADGHLEAVFRVGVSAIPAALALAERRGAVSGKELIAAVGVAEELLCRLGVSIARRRKSLGPWHAGILLGNFAATAAAARILGLNADQTERAFGIAYMQAGGTELVTAPDCNIRGMYAGFVGKTGVLAALMAQGGLLGPRGCLGSRDGLFNVYYQGAYDRQAIVEGLGREYELINLSFKPWPACALAHTYIDAMLGLRSEHSLRAAEIERIDVFSGEMTRELCGPIDIGAGRIPRTTNDAKRSIPFNVAIAALNGNVTFRDFTPEGLRNPEVLALAQKVRRVPAPELDEDSFTKKGNQLPPGRISVTDKRGRTFTKQTDFPYGHHLNPIRFDDLVRKFRDCLAFSPRPIPAQDLERVIDMILNLEAVTDIRVLLQLLA